MAHDIFISHASTNKAIADAACAALEQAGIRCWIAPRDIQPGSEWGTALIEGIKGSRVLLLVLSGAANRSPQILREVERAVHLGIPIIPLRVEEVMPQGALEFHLGTVHWLDAMTPPLEDHLARLVDIVRNIIAKPSSDAKERTRSPRADADEATPAMQRPAPSRARSPAMEPAADEVSERNLHVISVPVGGLLRSPSIDGSPFVRVGDRVEVGDLLCRIQSGQMVHDIEADVAGEIDDVFERPDTPIRPDTPLFAIRVSLVEPTEQHAGRAGPEESEVPLRFLRIRWDALNRYRKQVPDFEVKPLVRAGQTVKVGEPLARVTLGVDGDGAPIRAVVRSPVRGWILVASDGTTPVIEDHAPDAAPILLGIGFRGERTDVAAFAEIASAYERASWRPLRNWLIGTGVALVFLVSFVGLFFSGDVEPGGEWVVAVLSLGLAWVTWKGVGKIRAAWPLWEPASRSPAVAWDYGVEVREPTEGAGIRVDAERGTPPGS